MATQIIDLGKIRFSWQGAYSSSTEYELNDVIRYGGNLYAYIFETPSTNVAPTNTTYWSLIVNGVNYRGSYNNSTGYLPGDVVSYGGPGYICIAATTGGNLPSNTVYWSLFNDGFSWQGEYSALTAYKKNDIARYAGSSYIAKAATTGNLPTDITYWDIFSEGYPDPADNEDEILTTDGTTVSWTNSPSLTNLTVTTKLTSETSTYVGTGAEAFETAAALTDAALVVDIEGGVNSFAQVAFHNAEPTSSTDIIAYASNGDDSNGWVGIGITGSEFDDSTYGITGQGDSYVFAQAPAPSATRTVNNKLAGSGTATLTTSVDHGFLVGERVVVASVDALLDGAHTITAKTNNTFSFASAATISTTSASGTAIVGSAGNLVIATGDNGSDNKIVFAAGGYASGNTQMIIIPDEQVHIEIATASTSPTTGALRVAGGVGITGDTFTDGDLTLDGLLYVGPGAEAFSTAATLTDPAIVTSITGGASSFAQIAFQNQEPTSSTDIIAYMDNGDDAEGWMGMGITGSEFDDATFGITGPGDAYIFHETKSGPTGPIYSGNMVFATGENGLENKIVFAAGGFSSGTTQMEITPGVNVHIEIPTPSTSPTTGALTVVGGVGIQGDMNVEGSVFIEGTITFGGSGTTVETSNLAVTDPAVFVGTNNQSDIVDLAFIGEYATSISTITRTVSNKALTSNVATLTTSADHNYFAGDVVVVSGVDATFNGTYNIIAVPTATTFTFAKVAANVTSTSATGSAAVSARRKFAGIARDATDGIIKVFKDATTKPTSTVNFAEAGLAYADVKVNTLDAASATIGDVSNTELQYLNGVTGGIQDQIDGKASKLGDSFSGAVAINGSSASAKQLIVKGAASQSANVVEVQNSSATTVLSVDVTGNVSGTSFTSTNNSFFNNLRLNGGNSSDTIYLATGDIGISAASANSVKINTNNTTRLTVESDGRVKLPAGGVFESPAVTNAQTGTTYTVALADAGKIVELSNASAITLTVPLNSSVAFPIGTRIDLLQTGAGQVTVVGAGGVTLNGTGTKLRTTWSSASILKRGTDTWVLIGDIL